MASRQAMYLGFVTASLLVGGCSNTIAPAPTGSPDHPSALVGDTGRRITDADAEPQNWLSHGRNYQETRHSPLEKLTASNVSRLGLVWSYDLDTHRGQEATPLVVDGVMFTTRDGLEPNRRGRRAE